MRIVTLAAGCAGIMALGLGACARNPRPDQPSPAERYAALPDTTVCVVDRSTDTGLRELEAKRAPEGGVVLLVGGEIRSLDDVHPVRLIAGYGGQERWVTAGEPITFRERRFIRVEGERRIPPDKLSRVGEHRGILLFADPTDAPPPEAVYIPARPGCIFRAYVREELLNRR